MILQALNYQESCGQGWIEVEVENVYLYVMDLCLYLYLFLTSISL